MEKRIFVKSLEEKKVVDNVMNTIPGLKFRTHISDAATYEDLGKPIFKVNITTLLNKMDAQMSCEEKGKLITDICKEFNLTRSEDYGRDTKCKNDILDFYMSAYKLTESDLRHYLSHNSTATAIAEKLCEGK